MYNKVELELDDRLQKQEQYIEYRKLARQVQSTRTIGPDTVIEKLVRYWKRIRITGPRAVNLVEKKFLERHV